MSTATQQKSVCRHQKAKSRLDEKQDAFFDHLLPVIMPYSEFFKYQDYRTDWESGNKELRIFVKKLGFRLSDFDKVISRDLKTFLTCYYLIVEKKAPGHVIDCAYGQLLENTFILFMSELNTLIQNTSEMTEEEKKVFSIILNLGGGILDDLEISHSVPPISVAKSGFLHFLTCRGQSKFQQVEAILAAPYEPYVDCEPEEWLTYIHGSRKPEAFPMIRRILDALMDIIMGGNEPSAKPPVKVIA